MITETQKRSIQLSKDEALRKDCQEIINTSAVYERLSVNPDWKKHVEILKGLVQVHKSQIDGWMAQMAEASFFKRLKMMDVMLVHQVRKEQAEEWINYAGRVQEQARQAKEVLAGLNKKGVHTNGKPI